MMKAQPHKPFTILMADDDETRLTTLEKILEAEGRIFIKATTGHKALEMAETQRPSLILIGSGLSGTAHSMRALTGDTPIVLIDAAGDVMENVPDNCIVQPLEATTLKASVHLLERLHFCQEERRLSQEEKDRSNRLMERFMYVVAHDLKSPLSGAISMLLLMNEDERIVKEADLKEYMGIAVAATSRLSDMITAILDYTVRSEALQSLEVVNVSELVSQIARHLFPPAHIRILIGNDLPILETNRLKLEQVFQNLMANAIKYNDKKKGEISVGGEDRGDHYAFYVKDNGPGITSRDNNRIFKLFETLDQKGTEKGTGIGLNIMKLLVEEQGGKVWVESVPGEGSTFYFQWFK